MHFWAIKIWVNWRCDKGPNLPGSIAPASSQCLWTTMFCAFHEYLRHHLKLFLLEACLLACLRLVFDEIVNKSDFVSLVPMGFVVDALSRSSTQNCWRWTSQCVMGQHEGPQSIDEKVWCGWCVSAPTALQLSAGLPRILCKLSKFRA